MSSAIFEILRVRPPYRHHGRDTAGLDCVGLVLCVYRSVGLSLDHLDLPYGRRDVRRPRFAALLMRQLAREFDPVEDPMRDGDVVLLRFRPLDNHLGLVSGEFVVDMQTQGLSVRRVERVRAHVARRYRHRRPSWQ